MHVKDGTYTENRQWFIGTVKANRTRYKWFSHTRQIWSNGQYCTHHDASQGEFLAANLADDLRVFAYSSEDMRDNALMLCKVPMAAGLPDDLMTLIDEINKTAKVDHMSIIRQMIAGGI